MVHPLEYIIIIVDNEAKYVKEIVTKMKLYLQLLWILYAIWVPLEMLLMKSGKMSFVNSIASFGVTFLPRVWNLSRGMFNVVC